MILGVADDLLSAEEPRSHYLTKVGGAPWVPTAQGDSGLIKCSWEQSSNCKACGRSLSLVFQAYTPGAGPGCGESAERVLLVLGCTQPGCGRDARSWRAFRCQLVPAPTAESAADSRSKSSADQATCTSAISRGAVQLGQGPTPDTEAPANHHHQPREQQQGPPQQAAADDPFGGGFGCDGDTIDAFGVPSSPCGNAADAMDFSDLGAVLQECAELQQQQQQQQQQRAHNSSGRAAEARGRPGKNAAAAATGRSTGSDPPPAAASMELPLSGAPLPEFHIIGIEEPRGSRATVSEEHVQRLLEEYERQEGCSTAVSGTAHASGRAAAAVAGQTVSVRSDAMSTEDDGEDMANDVGAAGRAAGGGGAAAAAAATCRVPPSEAGGEEGGLWAGEQYEQDHVRGVQRPYLKYAARLARQPDQCARYERGGAVLWPLAQPPRPPPCERCGAARVFELQLMAPVLAVVLECAEWLAAEGEEALRRHRPAINAAANWDFVTLAVFTCGANCCYDGYSLGGSTSTAAATAAVTHWSEVTQGSLREDSAVVLVEEYLEMASEEQCHVPEELKLTG